MAQKCSELGFLVSSSVLWDDEDALNGNYNYNYYSDLWSGLPLPSSVAATARTSAEDSIPQVVAVSEALESDCGRVTTTTTNNNNVSADTQLSCETAATSSSGGSMSSPSKSNKVNESSKKKVLMGTQDNEYHSQKAQEDSDENFKQCSTGTSSKRSRAAEVHNLSEKRRRNRINEKMKALQSLIPNSNKTDKASMLDEAIEYLKKLQLQVQMLSARSGIDISSMRWLAQMPHLQMQQIPKACITTDQHAEVSLGMLLGPGLMNTDQGSEKRPLPLHDLCNSGGFGKTAIPINLPSERIDDHQSCIMDAPQGNFSLPQLPTTTQKFMR